MSRITEMTTEERATAHVGIKMSPAEKENLIREAKRYKMTLSDFAKRVLRLGAETRIVEQDFQRTAV